MPLLDPHDKLNDAADGHAAFVTTVPFDRVVPCLRLRRHETTLGTSHMVASAADGCRR